MAFVRPALTARLRLAPIYFGGLLDGDLLATGAGDDMNCGKGKHDVAVKEGPDTISNCEKIT